MYRGILQRAEHLDAAIEVPRHHVGGGDIHSRFGAGQALTHPKAVDAAMLQEAADHRFDADIVRQARHTGPQAADAAHDKFDQYAGLGGLVQRVDDVGVDQRIHLHPDRARLAVPHVIGLTPDVLEDALAQRQWRYRHAFDVARLGIAGDVVEDTRGVAADDRVRGEIG